LPNDQAQERHVESRRGGAIGLLKPCASKMRIERVAMQDESGLDRLRREDLPEWHSHGVQCIEQRHPMPCTKGCGQKGRRGHEHLPHQHEACTDGNGASATQYPVGKVTAERREGVHRSRVRPHDRDRFRCRPAETAMARSAGEKEHEDRQHSVKAETFPKLDTDDEPGATGISEP
jgi:hypothetical protein